MQAYSRDLRERVLARGDAGQSSLEVAKLFNVSSAWVRRLRQRRRELGTIDPLPPYRGNPSQITPEHHQQFRQILAQKPDATLAELKSATGLGVHVGQICRVLKKLGLSMKKKYSTPPNKTVRTSRKPARSGMRTSRK